MPRSYTSNLTWPKIRIIEKINGLHEAHAIARECLGDFEIYNESPYISMTEILEKCTNHNNSYLLEWIENETKNDTILLSLGKVLLNKYINENRIYK